MQVGLVCQQTLLPLLPSLEQQLCEDSLDKRVDAVKLVAKLLSLPNPGMHANYSGLLEKLLARCTDKQVCAL